MLNQSKFSRKAKLFKQASITHLIFFIILFAISAFKADTQSSESPSQRSSNTLSPSNMVKIGLMDIPEKENFSLEYFVKEKAYLKLVERDIRPYLRRKNFKPLICFISYAWGERYHEFWVKRFCEMLDKVGIQVLLDRWVIKKGNVLNEFIRKIEEVDWVIVVGTKLYLEKYNKRAVGPKEKEYVSRLEGQLIEYLVRYSTERGNRVVPILLEGTPEESLPFMLRHKISSEFTNNDYFEELLGVIRDLYNIDHRDKVFEGFIEKFRRYAIAAAANITEEERKAYEKKRTEEILGLDQEISKEIDVYKKEAFKLKEELEGEVDYIETALNLPSGSILPRLHSYMPYPRLKEYIARERAQQELRQKLNKEGICVISGYGGVGKSTLVAEYGHARKEERAVRWIPAETLDKLLQAYEDIVEELVNNDKYENSAQLELAQLKLKQELARLKEEHASYPKMLARMVYNTLVEHKQPSLLILDNAVDPTIIAACLLDRPKTIQVIITTRDKKSFKNYNQVELSSFAFEEGKAYIRQRLQELKPSEQDIEALIKEVGLIPQKLALATGYIAEINFMNIDRYINKLRILKQQGKKRQGKLVLPEANLGLEILDVPSQLVMRYGAYLDPDFIPLSLLSGLLKVSDEEKLNDILALLEKFSLITIINNSPTKQGIQIHREIQAACREYQDWKEARKLSEQNLRLSLLKVLNDYMPNVTEIPDSTWDQARLYASNVAYTLISATQKIVTNPLFAKLMSRMGNYNRFVACNFKEALTYHQEALKGYQDLYKDKHENIATSLDNIGAVYRRLGQYDQAVEYFNQSLKMRQMLYEGNHEEIATSLQHLGGVYRILGQYREALKCFKQALSMRKALYPATMHPTIAILLQNIGMVYRVSGKHKKALKYLNQALEMYNQTLGEKNHPDIAATIDNIGLVYIALEEYEKAVTYCKKALEIRRILFKYNYPAVACSLSSLARAYKGLQEYHEALNYYHQALEMRQALYTGNHRYIASSFYKLGDVYKALGKHQEALKYYHQALEMRQALYIGNHPAIVISLNSLGDMYKDLGEPQEALKYYHQSLKMFQALYLNKPDHPDIQKVKENIAQVEEKIHKAKQDNA